MVMDDLANTPAVAIDGDATRRIREEKRLTQLYVSKVVGVTTDTVSRWENNRYPTIRRENALKLAEALEVELDEILKKHQVQPQPGPVSASGGNRAWLVGTVVALFLVASLLVLLQTTKPPAGPVLSATRWLPPYAAPGSRILIRTELSVEKPLKGMILRETFPAGWRFIESFPPVSSLDEQIGVARWIFRSPPLEMTVFYLLEVADDVQPDADLEIEGEVIANPEGQRSAVRVQSPGHMQVAPLHWADSNGNRIIDDLEILELSDLTEKAGPMDLDWDHIEAIWEAGSYRWDEATRQFVPVMPPAVTEKQP